MAESSRIHLWFKFFLSWFFPLCRMWNKFFFPPNIRGKIFRHTGHKSHLCSKNFLKAMITISLALQNPGKTQSVLFWVGLGWCPSGPCHPFHHMTEQRSLYSMCSTVWLLLDYKLEPIVHLGWPQGPGPTEHCLSGFPLNIWFGLVHAMSCQTCKLTSEVIYPWMGNNPHAVVGECLSSTINLVGCLLAKPKYQKARFSLKNVSAIDDICISKSILSCSIGWFYSLKNKKLINVHRKALDIKIMEAMTILVQKQK